MRSLIITSDFGEVKIVDEPTYTFGSADNIQRYKHEIRLAPSEGATSVHGVLINNEPIVVFGASGGASGVHAHSAVILDSRLYLAIGNSVVCFVLANHRIAWTLKVDHATCFGIYYDPEKDVLVSHGELEIARINEDGQVLWSSSGADIFSEGMSLEDEYISVVDFERREYHFNYETGALISTIKPASGGVRNFVC